MKEAKKIWLNGKFVDWWKAKVHVLTHALQYGSGVFEGIRCYKAEKGSAIFRLKDHLQRLHNSAKTYQMKVPYSVESLSRIIKKLILVNKLDECYIRPLVYRGYEELGMNPLSSPVEIAIAAFELGPFLGEKSLKKGVRVKISPYERISSKALPLKSKATGQYVNSIIAKLDAINSGYDEAIMLNYQGFISEGTSENLFVVKEGEIYTPPESAGILLGITRDSIMKLATDLGYEVKETNLTRDFLYTGDEIFFTGTAAEITPIREVDERKIGQGRPGPITKKLQRKFFEVVRGKDLRYERWIDYL